MQSYQQKIDLSPQCFEHFSVPAKEVLFFDIETTGLSADSSFLYLIGVGYLSDNQPTLRQWFSEGVADEVNLLHAFFTFLRNYRLLVHYNGNTFDIPYLVKKCKQYQLEDPRFFFVPIHNESDSIKDNTIIGGASSREGSWAKDTAKKIISVDLFHMIKPHKSLLGLFRCRQKDVEQFLEIKREDQFDGGQLIEIYKQYLGRAHFDNIRESSFSIKIEKESGLATLPSSPSKALLYVLLLHNREDVTGLMHLCSLYPLFRLLNGSIPFFDEISFLDTELTASVSFPAPKPSFRKLFTNGPLLLQTLFCPKGNMTLSFEKEQLTVHIPYFLGELKYFFENFKDYYYLPGEDIAMHKSVATALDKSRRKSATASTCYIKKVGIFLPIPTALLEEENQAGKAFCDLIPQTFRQEKKSKICWFERSFAEAFVNEKQEVLSLYINSLIKM